jgi:hypothetical protein
MSSFLMTIGLAFLVEPRDGRGSMGRNTLLISRAHDDPARTTPPSSDPMTAGLDGLLEIPILVGDEEGEGNWADDVPAWRAEQTGAPQGSVAFSEQGAWRRTNRGWELVPIFEPIAIDPPSPGRDLVLGPGIPLAAAAVQITWAAMLAFRQLQRHHRRSASKPSKTNEPKLVQLTLW